MKHTLTRILIAIGLSVTVLLAVGMLTVQPARAGGVVGSGTPGSCTTAALTTALSSGGTVTFNCGAAPHTIVTAAQYTVTTNTTIDGGGRITLSGNDDHRLFLVTSGVTLTLKNLALAHGYDSGLSGFGGGAILNNGGTLIVQGSQIVDNFDASTSYGGGGIANFGKLRLENSIVSSNTAYWGGGLVNGAAPGLETLIINSTISRNDAPQLNNISGGEGGGIFNYQGATLNIVNSTVSHNRSERHGGGIQNAGSFSNIASAIRLYNATITGNQADWDETGNGTGGGIHNRTEAQVTVRNTILAGNYVGFQTVFCCLNDGQGNFVSGDYNLILVTSGMTLTGVTLHDVVGLSPRLSTLQENGGPTPTHAPLAGSPVINAGPPAGCADPNGVILTQDQRGFPRPGRCDIGAVEYLRRVFLPLVLK